MYNKTFGEVKFNTGWETKTTIMFHGNEITITVSADAYFEKDDITDAQEKSFSDFQSKKTEIMDKIEQKINSLEDGDNYCPALLVVKRNGDYGLAFDDVMDCENGIVVTVKPEMEVLSPDLYF